MVATLAVAAAAVAVTIAVIDARNNGHGQPGKSLGTSSSSLPQSASVAQAQATAIGNLLSTSKATRGQLGPAVFDIEANCSTLTPGQLSADVSTIKTVAMQRRDEYAQAQALQTDALPNGAQMKTDLLNALQYSMNADDDYLQWAQQEQTACTPVADSSAHSAAITASSQASSAKTAFANLWDSIAASYGQQTVSPTDI